MKHTDSMRRKDRVITDVDQVIQILKAAKILHLGLIDGDFPYIVPLHYGFEYDKEKDTLVFYMHGAKVGHKLDLIRENGNASIELETDVELESGGDNPCNYSSSFSSVMAKGTVAIVEDKKEKAYGLQLLMLNQTGRAFEFTDEMVESVAVIKVDINEYSAKARKMSR